MKDSTKDQVSGKVHEVKGKVIEKTGQLVNDPNLQQKGRTKRWPARFRKRSAKLRRFWVGRKGHTSCLSYLSFFYSCSRRRRLLWLRPMGHRRRRGHRAGHDPDCAAGGLSYGRRSLVTANAGDQINNDGDVDREDHDLRGREMMYDLINLERDEAGGGDDSKIFRPSLAK